MIDFIEQHSIYFINALIFLIGFVLITRHKAGEMATSLKELKSTVKETNGKLDGLALTLNTIQLEQKHQAIITERETALLHSEIMELKARINALEKK